jgi:hypothetical protein
MPESNLHTVIIIPGLGDDRSGSSAIITAATSHWKQAGLTILIHSVKWRNGEDFEPKLAKLLALIDKQAKKGTVSLVGTSAGASMAFNAFCARHTLIHKAVNICGRLRAGDHMLRSLDRMARTSSAFKQSVLQFEKNEPTLTKSQKSRLLTIRPYFGDELVPSDTAYLAGAQNRWIYTPGHGLSIILSLWFSKAITEFLTNKIE